MALLRISDDFSEDCLRFRVGGASPALARPAVANFLDEKKMLWNESIDHLPTTTTDGSEKSRTGVTVQFFLSREYRRLPLHASGADDTTNIS